MKKTVIGLALFCSALFLAQPAFAEMKEWTFLIYLNGHNNLDKFGGEDVNEMERVGSTDQINVLVQYATYTRPTTTRLYIQKDNDTKKITSPTVFDLGKKVDMGNYQTLTDFILWAAKNYPAKHYFISVWNHGSGWHRTVTGESVRDISYDDIYSSQITTKQFGQSIKESAATIGQPIDIVGADACLMAMPEVMGEMVGSVDVFVGSEETEPGDGWPYDDFLAKWVANPTAPSLDVGSLLTHEYVNSYSGGSQGSDAVTFSAFDMSQYKNFVNAMKEFGVGIKNLSAEDRIKVLGALNNSLDFAYNDYRDLGDFLNRTRAARVEVAGGALDSLQTALGQFVVANASVGSAYAAATGLSLWLPASLSVYNKYSIKYKALDFDIATNWSDALSSLFSPKE